MKINGERFYLWRAVDHEGEVFESFVTKRRDKAAAKRFLMSDVSTRGTDLTFAAIAAMSASNSAT